jgi:hypothetical protein
MCAEFADGTSCRCDHLNILSQVGVADSKADICIKCAMKDHYASSILIKTISSSEGYLEDKQNKKEKTRAFIVTVFYSVLCN